MVNVIKSNGLRKLIISMEKEAVRIRTSEGVMAADDFWKGYLYALNEVKEMLSPLEVEIPEEDEKWL